ncbi:Uncharacterised protein [Mycobacteroides abscessus subsp. abscessus]|nr:Uncharacterised protein [Mycobacteroides abscessus subsp. abscessus]
MSKYPCPQRQEAQGDILGRTRKDEQAHQHCFSY